MNEVMIAVGVIFLVCIIRGMIKGAVKIVLSLATTFLTLLIVVYATPYVADAITNNTKMDEMIRQKVATTIESTIKEQVQSQIMGDAESDGTVQEYMDKYGVTQEQLEQYGVTEEQLEQYKEQAGEQAGEQAAQALDQTELPRDLQIEMIEKSDLPEVFKSMLITNNNKDIYEELGVNTFSEYIGGFLAKLVVHIVSFLLTFLVVIVLFKVIIYTLDVASGLPVLGLVNHLTGGLIGLVTALIIVWFAFFIIVLLAAAGNAAAIQWCAMIEGNAVLKVIYDTNIIMKLAIKM